LWLGRYDSSLWFEDAHSFFLRRRSKKVTFVRRKLAHPYTTQLDTVGNWYDLENGKLCGEL